MSPTTSSPRVTSIARYTRGALPRTPLQQQQLSLSPIQGSTRAVSPPDLMCLLTETIISPIRQTATDSSAAHTTALRNHPITGASCMGTGSPTHTRTSYLPWHPLSTICHSHTKTHVPYPYWTTITTSYTHAQTHFEWPIIPTHIHFEWFTLNDSTHIIHFEWLNNTTSTENKQWQHRISEQLDHYM